MSNADDTLIPTAQVRRRYGNCSHMWVERRLKDDPDFPRPVYIAGSRFWRLGHLASWERAVRLPTSRASLKDSPRSGGRMNPFQFCPHPKVRLVANSAGGTVMFPQIVSLAALILPLRPA